MEPRHLADLRAERLIASGRLTLSALTLLAVWLDPVEPSRLPALGYSLASLYVVYSLGILALAWAPESRLLRWRLPTHVVDVIFYAGIIFFTSGATSPFFAYLVFALIAAALRWQWRGVFATAAAALAAYVVITAATVQPGADQSGVLLTFVIRTTYLGVFAVLLGHLGAHYQRLRRDMDVLSALPSTLSSEPSILAVQLLDHAALALKSREAAMLWRDRDWSYFLFSRGAGGSSEERVVGADELESLLAPEVAGRSFVARDGRAPGSAVLFRDGLTVRSLHDAALGPDLPGELPAGPVISLLLSGSRVEGRLFAFGTRTFSDEDLVLGELLTRQIGPELDRAVASLRDRRAAASAERVRLARDLHDGVIQSLTGASLRLQSVDRVLETEPLQARRLLTEVEDLLVSEQQELRWFLAESRDAGDWTERLPQLFDRMERNWGLNVRMEGALEGVLTGEFGHEVYRIVQEALANAARHGRAGNARVEVSIEDERLRLTVSDDGEGFPFSGELDDAALRARRLGPVSIKQRVAGLGGRLRINSSGRGARLDIQLPLRVHSS